MQTATVQPSKTAFRIQSIDLLRGLVMVIMALDHVRDYFHSSQRLYDPLDLSHTSTPIFLTRWITHFCAPVFVFLAGTSAWFVGVRKSRKELAKFLFTRGLWLLFIEIIIMDFAHSFDWRFGVIGLRTIWALGISMIFLSFLIYLPKRILLAVSLSIIALHNLLDTVHVPGIGADALGWSIFHEPHLFAYYPFKILVAYPVLPWIAVMAAGYCFGELYTKLNAERRKKIMILLGSACILLFILIRLTNWYGDPGEWSKQTTTIFTFLSFINVTKYPPSLLYILITLGPAILFLAFAEKTPNQLGRVIITYGKVPMFYYIVHFYLIHICATATNFIIKHFVHTATGLPVIWHGFRLWAVYLIWIIIVVALYPLCKRYAQYKFSHPEKWWLSYL